MTDRDVMVMGASGTIGRRLAQRLREAGRNVLAATRSGAPAFDWQDSSTWSAWAGSAEAVFVMAPDGVPVDPELLDVLVGGGARRLVLLSSKGIEAMDDQRLLSAEQAVRETGVETTIVRADWFDQNFDEGFFRDAVLAGEIALPVGDLRQAFNDADDVAAVAAAALLDDAHDGAVLEVGGPEALSFGDVAAILARVTGRAVRHAGSAERYVEVMTGFGMPEEQVRSDARAFAALAAAGDAEVTDTVERVTGRPPVPFHRYAEAAAARGAWTA
jgi:uncharacterized protein YbjT (DUF2867 family)